MVNLTLPNGEEFRFDTKVITKDLSCAMGTGKIEVAWDGEYGPADVKQEGRFMLDMSQDVSDRIDEARAEYKRRKKAKLLKDGEPKSIQIPFYFQWRIHLPMELNGRDDLLSVLAFITCFRYLIEEIPRSG